MGMTEPTLQCLLPSFSSSSYTIYGMGQILKEVGQGSTSRKGTKPNYKSENFGKSFLSLDLFNAIPIAVKKKKKQYTNYE